MGLAPGLGRVSSLTTFLTVLLTPILKHHTNYSCLATCLSLFWDFNPDWSISRVLSTELSVLWQGGVAQALLHPVGSISFLSCSWASPGKIMEAQNTKASRSQSTVSLAAKMAAISQCVSVSYEGTSRPLEESQAVRD